MFRDGDFSKIIQIYEVIQFKVSSAANYPLYLIPEDNLIDFVYKSFLRLLYFLYGPFAWELERYRHIIAFGDGLLHLFITINFLVIESLLFNMFILSTFFILFLLSFNLFLISRFKDLEGFIIFSFLIKICILIINNNLFFVMDGSADALNFHNHMVEYSRKPISIIFDKGFHGIYFLSQIGGLIYKFFGESIYLMQFLSITISIASLILFNRTIKLLTKIK